jgi:tetratricopeptide (TPR) repeat protein
MNVQPDDGELEHLRGVCLEARGAYADAVAQYKRAIRRLPGRIDTYSRCANLLRDRLRLPGDSENLLNKMVEANQRSFRAYLARAQFRQEPGCSDDTLTAAKKDVMEALRLAPDEVETLLAAADVTQKQAGALAEARIYLQRLVDLHPKDSLSYVALAGLESREADFDEAIKNLRRGLKELPEQSDLLWNLANLLIQKGELREARELLAKLGTLDLPAARIDYLDAAIQFREGHWREASKKLEAIRPLFAGSREWTVQCDLLLAECYEREGDFDRQLLVYRRVLSLDASQSSARLGVASALVKLGRMKEALEECQRMMSLPRPPADGWILWARVLVAQNIGLPPSRQKWEKADEVLESAAQALPESTEVPILRAEMLAAQKKFTQARTLLEQARDRQPQRSELWIALANLENQAGKPETALALLDEAEAKLGDGVGPRLARLRILVARLQSDGSTRVDRCAPLTKLEQGLEKLADVDRALVLAGLADAYCELRQFDEARRLWNQAATLQPEDLQVHLRLFDLALESNGKTGMEEALAAMERIVGAGGPLGHYHKARLLIWRAVRGEKSLLAAAREELAMLSKRRPAWSRVPYCLGKIDELEGSQEQAIEHYLRALELGDRQVELVQRLIQLLYERRRYADADLVIKGIAEQTPLSGDLRRLAAEVSLRARDYDRALDLAQQAVPSSSKDYRDHIWLGQLLWVAAQQPDIEPARRQAVETQIQSALHRAVEMAENVPDTWVALVQHFARTGQTKDAETAIREAQGKLPKEQASFALAQCYAAIQRLQEASECYRSALQAKPNDPTVLRNSADFYVRIGKLREAESCLRNLIVASNEPSTAAWAQRTLAVVLAASGDYRRGREALLMLGRMENGKAERRASNESVENQRAMAAVLALQPSSREQRKAINILETLRADQALSAEDQFLLTQLYEKVGDERKARERIVLLLGSEPGNPRYVAHFVGTLLRQGQIDEAETWLATLEKLQPQVFSTVELKARLLKAQGKGAEVVGLFPSYVQRMEPETELRIAALLEELNQGAAAERWYRQYVADSKLPEAALLLAKYLGRQNRLSEALELCERAWAVCRPEVVGDASLDALRTARAGEDECVRVERWLERAVQQHPQATGLLLCLGGLHDLRGRYQNAEATYQQVIERDERSVVALNNLAWLLALGDGNGERALLLINRAIDIAGPVPGLLDTRAVAYLVVGRSDLALADLDESVRPGLGANVLASVNFHRVQAYQMAGKHLEAAKAWRAAKASGLEATLLHPLELKEYEELAGVMDRS